MFLKQKASQKRASFLDLKNLKNMQVHKKKGFYLTI